MCECLPICGLPGITANTFLSHLDHHWHNGHFCSHIYCLENTRSQGPHTSFSQSNLLWSKALLSPICGTCLGLVLKSRCVATYWQTLNMMVVNCRAFAWRLSEGTVTMTTNRKMTGWRNDANRAKGRLISWWQSDHDRVCSLADGKALSKSWPGDCY